MSIPTANLDPLRIFSTNVHRLKPAFAPMGSSDPERPSSAGRCGGENRQLSIESTPEGRPRFAAGYIGGEVRIFVQYIRSVQPAQHGHHQKVTGAERTIEPIGIAQATGKFGQPVTDAILDDRQALLVPGLVALQERGDFPINDRRLQWQGSYTLHPPFGSRQPRRNRVRRFLFDASYRRLCWRLVVPAENDDTDFRAAQESIIRCMKDQQSNPSVKKWQRGVFEA